MNVFEDLDQAISEFMSASSSKRVYVRRFCDGDGSTLHMNEKTIIIIYGM